MALSNLRKAIFYLQQAIREDKRQSTELLDALDILVKKEKDEENSDFNSNDSVSGGM